MIEGFALGSPRSHRPPQNAKKQMEGNRKEQSTIIPNDPLAWNQNAIEGLKCQRTSKKRRKKFIKLALAIAVTVAVAIAISVVSIRGPDIAALIPYCYTSSLRRQH